MYNRSRPLGSDQTDTQGFRSIQRFWDSSTRMWTVRILPGEYYVTCENESISTILGSCVSACIGDPEIGMGGMNHFLLRWKSSETADNVVGAHPIIGAESCYGSYAMERLINALVSRGAQRHRLQVKLFGGAQLFAFKANVGSLNIAFVRKYLKIENLEILAEDLGETFPRRVVYFPATGKVRVRRLGPVSTKKIVTRERLYREEVDRVIDEDPGEVELFN